MIIIASLLLLAGAAFIIAEIFVPGFGVCGITGFVLIAASSFLTIVSSPFGIIIVCIELVVVFAVVFALFTYIKSKQLYGKIILDETLNFDKKEIGDLNYFYGKEGIAKTSLRPQGTVDFNGVSMDVYSDGGYVAENKRVKVVEIKNNKIIVNQTNTN